MSLNHHNKGGIDEVNGSTNEVNVEKKEKKRVWYGRRLKKVFFAKFRKAKKRFLRKKMKKGESGCLCCCLYIKKGESSGPGFDSCSGSDTETPTSDPNSPGFGFDSLKCLIEKSDFLLDECNTHLGVYSCDDDDNFNDNIDNDDDD
nr:hypothetical protein [Tanacetum cinerariifolium]